VIGYLTSPKIALGAGAIEQLGGLGIRRAFLVADPNPALATFRQRVTEELAKSESVVELYDIVEVDPTLASLPRGVDRARGFGPDWIVAVGGGSAIDTAKGIWVGLERPDLELSRIGPLTELGLRQRARLVAVPTTSGAGAEAAWSAGFRSPDGAIVTLSSRELVADWALLDPAVAHSLPMAASADGAAEALAHALEAVASEWSHPFANAFAREALTALVAGLPRLAKNPDEEVRATLHYAATMAGIASANSQTGLAGALATTLRGAYRLPHGRLLGVVLPYVLEFNYGAARDRYQSVGTILGPPAVASRAALAERVRGLLTPVGIPRSLRDLGIPMDGLESVLPTLAARVERTPSAVANPRVASRSEIERLLRAVADGVPVNF
jgi:alcohol dehydrogenase class IV